MRALILRSAVFAAAAFQCFPQTAPQPATGGAESDQVRIDKIELLDLQTDRIGLAVSPSFTPTRQVQVKTITFYGMKINRIPFFIPPVTEEIMLRPGVRATLRRPMSVTVYLRDLNSLEPLLDAVKGGHVHIEGYALVEAKLDLLPSLVLLKRTAHAPLRIDANLPLAIPGGSLAREQALKALTGAEAGRKLVRNSLLALLGTDETQKQLQARFGASVMLAVARFELIDSNHNRYPVEKMGVAFRAGEKQVITPREMTEPWRFDPVIAMKLQRHELTIVNDSFDLLLWPAGSTYSRFNGRPIGSAAVSLKRRNFRISDTGDASTERSVSAELGKRPSLVTTVPRASISNLSLLEFSDPIKAGPAIEASDAIVPPEGYSALVAFRFAAGPYTETVEPEIVRLSGKVSNGRIVLDDPVDASALGSPLIDDAGLVGILQDETSAILYRGAAAKLKLNVSGK
jgi:hypothetical protein